LAREGAWPPGVERSLIAGTTYHRMLIDMTSRLAEEAAGQGAGD
jgi:hypothetical protein